VALTPIAHPQEHERFNLWDSFPSRSARMRQLHAACCAARLDAAIEAAEGGWSTIAELAEAIGITPGQLRSAIEFGCNQGDERAQKVLRQVSPLHERRRRERLEDCLDLIEFGEHDRAVIASRLGLSLSTLDRALHRWRNAGDERATEVLARTHSHSSRAA
jgi:hypothetical protein